MKNLYKTRLKRLAVAGGVGLAGLTMPMSSLYAQVEEIVIQARKVQENLQEVPISVTAITGEGLKDAGITEFPQISAITPNFDVRANGVRGEFFAVLNIRGQDSTTSDLSIDQAVGININGAPVTRGTNLFGNLFDIEQVEILRGPQGTLFGKNTTGGTVIVRTTAPQLGEFSGYGEVTIGNYNQNDAEAVVNIPFGQTAALRLGAAVTNRDGFGQGINRDGVLTNREFGDDNEDFYRASFLIEPSDTVSVRVNADYHEVEEAGGITRVLRDGAIFGGAVVIAAETIGDDLFQASDNRGARGPEVSAEEININTTVEVDLGFADFTSLTSFRNQESFTFLAYAASADIPIGQDSELWAQEFRLAGSTDKFKWQTGLFISNEEGEDFNDTGGRGDITYVENDSFSVFAQGTFNFTDKLGLTVGARWTDEERFVDRIVEGGVPTNGLDNSADFDGTSWTVALDYQVNDEILTYASISRGFRSGGIDGDANIETVVDPEYVLNYELGFKADFFENTLRVNGAIWSSDYEDIQIQSFSVDPNDTAAPGVPAVVLRNAAEATLEGIELEVEWAPTENFSISMGYGYTDGEYDEFLEPRLADPMDPSSLFFFDRSNEPIGGPENQFSTTARYSFNVSSDVQGSANLTYAYIDEQELAGPEVIVLLDEGQDIVKAYGLWNGQVDFDFADGFSVTLWGKNLADKEYVNSGFALGVLGLGLAQRNTAPPRQYGVRLRKEF